MALISRPHRAGATFGKFLLPTMCGLPAAGLAVFPSLAGTTGRISGVLKDSAGAVIAGAQLTATNTATGVKSSASTDKKGAYGFLTLSAGRYDLHAEAKGFKPQNRPGVIVHVDDVIRIDLVLETDAEKAAAIEDLAISHASAKAD